LAFEVINNFRR